MTQIFIIINVSIEFSIIDSLPYRFVSDAPWERQRQSINQLSEIKKEEVNMKERKKVHHHLALSYSQSNMKYQWFEKSLRNKYLSYLQLCPIISFAVFNIPLLQKLPLLRIRVDVLLPTFEIDQKVLQSQLIPRLVGQQRIALVFDLDHRYE